MVREALWHNPFMAVSTRAIAQRIPLGDLILHVTDARIPLSSQCNLLRNYPTSSNQIIAVNKADLASRSTLRVWVDYFREMHCISWGVNAHNKDSIRRKKES